MKLWDLEWNSITPTSTGRLHVFCVAMRVGQTMHRNGSSPRSAERVYCVLFSAHCCLWDWLSFETLVMHIPLTNIKLLQVHIGRGGVPIELVLPGEYCSIYAGKGHGLFDWKSNHDFLKEELYPHFSQVWWCFPISVVFANEILISVGEMREKVCRRDYVQLCFRKKPMCFCLSRCMWKRFPLEK